MHAGRRLDSSPDTNFSLSRAVKELERTESLVFDDKGMKWKKYVTCSL